MKRIVIAYVFSVVFSLGSLNAFQSHAQESGRWLCEPRKDYAEMTVFALIPLGNVFVAIFGTGFMEHGWTLAMTDCKAGPR